MGVISSIPFFNGVVIKNIDHINKQCLRKKFKSNEIILDYEDKTADVGFVLSGSIRVLIRNSAGKEMIFAELGEGGFIGEMSAIDGHHRSANVTALSNSEILFVPNKIFRELCFNEPELSKRLMSIFAERIRELNLRLFERTVLDIRHRLYSELLRMSVKRKDEPSQLIISPPPFQHDLAARVGCRREQINRELNIMLEDSLLEKKRGGLIIIKPNVLKKRLAEAMAGSDV